MKKILTVLMILAIAGSLFVGCSRSTESGGPVTLTMWNQDSNTTDITIPAFERSHPHIRIERVPISWDEFPLKIQQSLMAGLEMPDFLFAEITYRGQMFAMDIWENLEQPPYNATKDLFFESSVGLMQNARGEIIAIDHSPSPTGLAYKKGPARQWLGTDDRTALENMFQSLDDFVRIGAEVSRASGGNVFMFSSPQNFLTWMRKVSPLGIVDSDGAINFTGIMRDGIDLLIRMRNANAVDVFEAWSPQDNTSFAGDNHIFYLLPNWGPAFMFKPFDPDGQGRWGVMIPPTGAFSWGGTAQGIYKDSKHKAEAWEYLYWFSFSEEGTALLKRENDYYTPVKRFYDDASFASNFDPYFGIDTGSYFFLELMPTIVPPTFSIYDGFFEQTSHAVANFVMADRSVTTQQALAMGIEELQSRVDDRQVK